MVIQFRCLEPDGISLANIVAVTDDVGNTYEEVSNYRGNRVWQTQEPSTTPNVITITEEQ